MSLTSAQNTKPLAATAMVAVLLVACEQRPPIRYETEHLRIGTGFDEPLCRGDLDHMELIIGTVEAELSTTMSEPVEVYLWATEEWPPDPDTCDTDVDTGCFTGKRIYSSLLALDHELVHAVVRSIGQPEPFWNEGAAVGLQSSRVRFGQSAPVDNLNLDSPVVSYQVAGHFSRYLLETHGADLYRTLLRADGSPREVFEDTYGMSVEVAQEQYFADAPYSYAPLVACEYPDLAQTGDLRWSETIELDCDDADVYGGPYGMGTYRVVTIEERGYYAISTTAATAVIARCMDEDLPFMPIPDDPALGDVPPLTPVFPAKFVMAIPGEGETTALDLVPGRYEIEVSYADHEPRETTLDIWAHEGPLPQIPESSP